MWKKLAVFLMAVLLYGNVYAEIIRPGIEVIDIASADDTSFTLPTSGTSTIYSKSFALGNGNYFGVAYQSTSTSGTPTVKIELEESWTTPATEGSSDTNYIEPESFSDIETTLTTETWHIKSLSPVVAPYGRFKFTGNSGNPGDCTSKIKVLRQDK